jgi:hypothetical protein
MFRILLVAEVFERVRPEVDVKKLSSFVGKLERLSFASFFGRAKAITKVCPLFNHKYNECSIYMPSGLFYKLTILINDRKGTFQLAGYLKYAFTLSAKANLALRQDRKFQVL